MNSNTHKKHFIMNVETKLESHSLDTIKDTRFKQFYKKLQKDYNTTYSTYILEDKITNEVFYFSSNPTWQEIFERDKIINICPIYAFARSINTRGLSPIIWNRLRENETKMDKELNDFRASYNVANGIGFMNNLGDRYKEAFCFASTKKDTDFSERVLKSGIYIDALKEYKILKNQYIGKK